jgi:hypothetical protein
VPSSFSELNNRPNDLACTPPPPIYGFLLGLGARGSVVETLCYKPEGRGFETRRGHFFFQFT